MAFTSLRLEDDRQTDEQELVTVTLAESLPTSLALRTSERIWLAKSDQKRQSMSNCGVCIDYFDYNADINT